MNLDTSGARPKSFLIGILVPRRIIIDAVMRDPYRVSADIQHRQFGALFQQWSVRHDENPVSSAESLSCGQNPMST
jgi:hypothetical protein